MVSNHFWTVSSLVVIVIPIFVVVSAIVVVLSGMEAPSYGK